MILPKRLLLAAAVVIMFWSGANTTCRAGLATGLDAYYHLDGNGVDASGNGLNLDVVGGAGFGPGLFGQALALHNDPSQYATQSGNDSALNFGSSNFTIQVWVNFNTFGTREQTLIEKFTGSAGPGWTLTTPNDNIQFYAGGIRPVNSEAGDQATRFQRS
jgi:hypothetical protein